MDGRTYDNYYNAKQQHEVIVRIILSGICVVSTAASLFLAITILRFKRLRTRTNIYIIHLSVTNVTYNILIIISLARDIATVQLFSIQNSFVLMYVIFAFLLALDWFLTTFKPNWILIYKRFYKFAFISIYVIFFILLILFSVASDNHSFKLTIFIAIYFFIIMLLILLNVLRDIIKIKIEAPETKYGFTVANIISFSYIPCLFHHCVYVAAIFDREIRSIENFFYFITFLPYVLWISHPILVVYILGYLNEHFRMAYHKSIKRSTNYTQDELAELYKEEAETNH